MLNIVLEVGWGYGQRGPARTCEAKQVKNRIRGRGRVIGHRSGVKGQGHTQRQGQRQRQNQDQYQDQESKVRVRIRDMCKISGRYRSHRQGSGVKGQGSGV